MNGRKNACKSVLYACSFTWIQRKKYYMAISTKFCMLVVLHGYKGYHFKERFCMLVILQG